MAREGFTGAAAPIEGRHGFLHAYAPDPDVGHAVAGLGVEWETMRTGLKPYPSCRWGHAGIDAALALREELGLDPVAIELATLGLSRAGLLLIGEPLARKQAPGNAVEAQFSGPFVIACALLNGKVGLDSLRQLHDPALRDLMTRIICVHDVDIEAEFPTNMSGKVAITVNGKVHSRTVIMSSGDPGNFPTADRVRAKFFDLTSLSLGTEAAHTLYKAIGAVDRAAHAVPFLFPRASSRYRVQPRVRHSPAS